jgi:single-stranded DNA-specific DHH superfamily exonuclease
MPKINFKQAKEFLDNITNEDKVAVIHHDDGDGFCSGVLFYDWCKQKGAGVEAFSFSINKSKIKDYDLKKFNKIIITDLASGFVAEQLDYISDKEVFYTDHHPEEGVFPKEILTLITSKGEYFPSSRTAQELTGLKPWLGLAGTISDAGELYKENEDYINNNLKNTGLSLDKFKEKITSVITNTLIYFDKNEDKAFDIIKNLNSIEEIESLKKYSNPVEDEIQKFVNEYGKKGERLGSVNFYSINPEFSIKTAVSSILSRNNPEEVFIFASSKNDGLISLSARNIVGKLTAKKVLAAGVKNLEDSRSGGHEVAAGGIIQAKDLEKFKENIRKYLEGNPRK